LCVTDIENFNEGMTSGRRGNKVASVLRHVETFFPDDGIFNDRSTHVHDL
jgi:hypothetical protein